METMQAITTRRSIRKFKKEKISTNIINDILKAAMFAPSARNQQPWQFIVIDERSLLDEIPLIHPHANMCKTAPLAILVCADLSFEISKDMWAFDCAAATQNILLAAHDKGLGSVWVGVYFRKELVDNLKKFFKLPNNIIPISLIPMGHPDEKAPKAERFKKERIHYNSF